MQNICQRLARARRKVGLMATIKRIKMPKSPYTNYLLMIAAPAIVSWYYYGALAVKNILVGVVSALVFEMIALLIMKRSLQTLADMHAVFTGFAIAMMLPATVPVWIIGAGTAFAILVAKIPFGSARRAPFVPAAAGMAFLTICFPDQVFRYPDINSDSFGIFDPGASLASQLSAGGVQHVNALKFVSIISGNISGALGTCCALALLGSCALLAVGGAKRIFNVLGFLAACAALAVIFPRGSFSRLASLLTELCAGSLLFSGIFFITDPATSPKHPLTRFIYGAFAGVVCMLLRYFGAFEDSTCFGVLLTNAFWPIIDSALRKIGYHKFIEKSQAKRIEKKNTDTAEGGEPA